MGVYPVIDSIVFVHTRHILRIIRVRECPLESSLRVIAIDINCGDGGGDVIGRSGLCRHEKRRADEGRKEGGARRVTRLSRTIMHT